MTRVTEAERALVSAFIEQLYEKWAERNPGKVSYAEFARQAGVSYSSLAVWRAGPTAKKRATPEAPDLLKMLRVSGAVDQDYRLIPAEEGGLGEAAAAAQKAEADARALAERESPAQRTSKRA